MEQIHTFKSSPFLGGFYSRGDVVQFVCDADSNLLCTMDECSFGLGAKLIYMGYFASLLHRPGRKTWLLFSVRDMSWGLRNPCFTKFSVVSFL